MHKTDPTNPSPPSLLLAAGRAWLDDRCATLGAALAYYTLFSLAPLLLIVVSIGGLVFGDEAARGQLGQELQGLLGDAGAQAVQGLLASTRWPAGSLLSTVVALAVMLVGATTVFAELQNTLDHIWRAPAPTTSGLWSLLRSRVLSFGLVLGVGFLLVVSLVLDTVLSAAQARWSPWFGDAAAVAAVVGAIVGFMLSTVMFAMIYKWMPRVHIAWRDVWAGALMTSALFSAGRHAIGLYLGHSAITSGYGAAGSLVLVLVWVYYSAQIFLFGAELTWVMAQQRNRHSTVRWTGPKRLALSS